MFEFYRIFQKRSDYIEQAISVYVELVLRQKFYFYYNDLYWFIDLKAPYVGIKYENVPLPGFKKLNWKKKYFLRNNKKTFYFI